MGINSLKRLAISPEEARREANVLMENTASQENTARRELLPGGVKARLGAQRLCRLATVPKSYAMGRLLS